jgi:hypothetical protein
MTSNRLTIPYSTNGGYVNIQSEAGEVLVDRTNGRIVTENGNGGWVLHATKDEVTAVTQAVSSKADQASVTSALADKVSNSTFALNLSSKANSSDVTTALATKANVSDVTASFLTKSDRYPINPASVLLSNYTNNHTSWLKRFFDTSNNRLYPTRGLGPTNAGCPDLTLPDGSGNRLSPWQWAQGINALYHRWKFTGSSQDQQNIVGAWAYFKTQFTNTQIIATTYGQNPTSGLSDDNSWFANALRQIHEASADSAVLSTLIEYVSGTYITYTDNRSTNPIVSYGVSTPGGITIQRNTLGIRYDQGGGYGDIAAWYEIGLAICDLYVYQQPTTSSLTTQIKSALMQRAVDTWSWAQTRLKFAGTSSAAAGIYVSALNLSPTASPGSQRFTDIYGTTQRGRTAFADHGTLAMGVLSDILFSLTNDTKYLTELQSIAIAYPTLTTGFGRLWNGLPCFVNAQDPWTNGFWHAEFTRRLLARYPNPTDYSTFKLAVIGAAKIIAAQSAYGIISPNWGPPEQQQDTGQYTWEQDSLIAAYSGAGGGGQASGRQIMTASSSLCVIASGAMLISVEAALGSGMNAGAVEILTADVAAALAGISASKLRPMEEMGPIGKAYRRSWDGSNNRFQEFINESEIRRIDSGGETLFGSQTLHGSLVCDNGITTNSGGIQAFATTFGGQLYIGSIFSGGGINLGYSGSNITADGNALYCNFQNNNIVTLSGNGIYLNGSNTYVLNDILPVNDNVISVGGTSLRFKNIYATNGTIKTSDERTKDWIQTGLSNQEYRAALRILQEIGSFKWLDNPDRIHYGVRAQAAWRICIEEGLIPDGSMTNSPVSFLVYDKWDAKPAVPEVKAVAEVSHVETRTLPDGSTQTVRVIDVEAVMGIPGQNAVEAGDRYGVRDEIDKFMLAAIARLNATQIEAALHAQ